MGTPSSSAICRTTRGIAVAGVARAHSFTKAPVEVRQMRSRGGWTTIVATNIPQGDHAN